MPDKKSLQRCHCGWESVTTYQGLRTHQGIKGCTIKGSTTPSSPQPNIPMPNFSLLSPTELQGPDRLPYQTTLDNKSLQRCHCGWESVTTHQGLRTHQGKRGCTIKGSTTPSAAQLSFLSTLEQQGLGRLLNHDTTLSQLLPSLERFQEDQTQRALTFPGLPPLPAEIENEMDTAAVDVWPPSSLDDMTNSALPSAASMDQTRGASRSNGQTASFWPNSANESLQIFGSPPGAALAESTPKQEGAPLFGSAQQPLLLSDPGNRTRSALDSMVGQPQFVKASAQTFTTNSAAANGKENQSAFQSPQPPAPPRAQGFAQTNVSQAISNCPISATGKDETLKSWGFSMGPASQQALDLNSKQHSIKPALSDVQLKTSNAPMDQRISGANPFEFSQNSGAQQSQPPAFTARTETSPFGAQKISTTRAQKPQPSEDVPRENTPGLFLSTTSTSQRTSDFNSKQPTAPNTRDATTNQNFGKNEVKSSTFAEKPQSQSVFSPSFAHQSFQTTKPEPPKTQMTSNCSPPTQTSNGAGQIRGFDANPTDVMVKGPNSGGPQRRPKPITPKPQTPSTSARESPPTQTQRPPSGESGPKPASSSTTPPSTKPSCALQTSSDYAPPIPKHSQQQEYQQSVFQTPQSFRQSAAEGNQTRRALDFSTGAEQIQQDQTKAELMQKVRSREQKLCEVRSSVKACKCSLDKEWLEINNVFSDVIKIVLEARQRSLQPLENRKNKLKEAAQSVFTKIQADIEKLEKAIQEVDAAADLERVNSLSKLIMKDYGEGALDMSLSFGTLQSILPSMMEQIQEELKRFAALELDRASEFAEDVKLDPTTAHQWLVVSKDGKKVQDGGQSQQELPPAPGRFDMFCSILGANHFRSGRAYWEVQVGGKTGWDLGVASVNANRKGKLTLAPDQGYWAIVHYEGEGYAALTAPPVRLQLKEKPHKVAVFLDYDEGLVSFYDVTDKSHIHSFTNCSFGDGVFPYFSPHLRQNGQNLEPLVITPMTI